DGQPGLPPVPGWGGLTTGAIPEAAQPLSGTAREANGEACAVPALRLAIEAAAGMTGAMSRSADRLGHLIGRAAGQILGDFADQQAFQRLVPMLAQLAQGLGR